MVQYEILESNADVRPLHPQQGKWKGAFDDLALGKDIKLSGTIDELRLARNSILASNHFRKRKYPEQHFVITTRLMMVDGKLSLVISKAKE